MIKVTTNGSSGLVVMAFGAEDTKKLRSLLKKALNCRDSEFQSPTFDRLSDEINQITHLTPSK